ncbi:DUF3791 domain-containing protein [Glaesserella parasuis]|uniref:DUF3791 domain-containing protein n=5 Tax=Glaesserella parasuis TaxID=738 RepID=B8F4X3_GLAP5|nr:hypothetical protein [Glaesserella parasuis]AGO15840.1 hypothetical protein K756_03035 [Glaesserella parasuis ZJ0906]ACL32375.1 hypothetical protein HAPS_0730 [Glaesserella parasuis SH0165]AIK16767.1 membrane protein [Glaesserella parasuis]ATW45187.1 DUF3791 domain-containing protein [Glaesserella parasuis str. Nagasaki]EMY46105.1 hypothetical protein OE7_06360 [Glaesserella parasuis gx033]
MKAHPVLLQRKYTRIISLFAQEKNISLGEALDKFMYSNTYLLMRKGIGDFHCLSDGYLVDELLIEYEQDKIISSHQ